MPCLSSSYLSLSPSLRLNGEKMTAIRHLTSSAWRIKSTKPTLYIFFARDVEFFSTQKKFSLSLEIFNHFSSSSSTVIFVIISGWNLIYEIVRNHCTLNAGSAFIVHVSVLYVYESFNECQSYSLLFILCVNRMCTICDDCCVS